MNRYKNWRILFRKYQKRMLSVCFILIALFHSLLVHAYDSPESENEAVQETVLTIVALQEIETESRIEAAKDEVEEIIAALPSEVKVVLNNDDEDFVNITWTLEEMEEAEEGFYRYRMSLAEDNYQFDVNFSEENIPYVDIVVKDEVSETVEESELADEEIELTDEEVYSVEAFATGGTTWTTFNEGKKTLGDVLGINRGDLLSWLGKHVNDSYYLSTPYKGGDYRNPNGDPAGYGAADTIGVPAMNCTGFVWHALTKAGANSNTPALKGWYTLLVNNNVEYRTYYNVTGINDCLNTILTDGYIEPGDLVWTWDSSCAISSVTGMPPGTSADHHIGIYIGKYYDSIKKTNESGEFWQTRKDANRWWHSSDHGLAYNFNVDGNQTSLIMPKTACSAVTVIKMSKTSELVLKKTSQSPELTDNDSYYSLENAEYGVYTEVECKNLVATLITDRSGSSNTVILSPNKNYYVKEISASKGYELDTKIYSVWMTANQTITLDVKETPKTGKVVLKKVSANPELTENNDKYSLEGAVYGVYSDVACTDLIHTLETDAEGNSNEVSLIPSRTYYIKEITAPKGFELDTKTYSAWITANQTVTLRVIEYLQGGPDLELNIIKKLRGSDLLIPNVVFRHTLPGGLTRETVTDENGKAVFTGLTTGEHIIEEVSVPDGFVKNPGKLIFEVTEDNEIILLSNSSEEETGSMFFEVQAEGTALLTVEDILAPYSLIVKKVNEEDILLEGAEFTIYSDEECINAIETKSTDKEGILTFENLEVGKSYYLKETKAPQGYGIDENNIENLYQVRAESNPLDNVFEYYLNEEKHVETEGDYAITGTKTNREVNLKIVNYPGIRMPATGTSAMLVLSVSGFCIMLGVIVYLLIRGKDKK